MLVPGAAAAGAAAEWWCGGCGCGGGGASSSGLFRAEAEEDRATEQEDGRQFPLETPRSWPVLNSAAGGEAWRPPLTAPLTASGAPVDAAMSPNILALIFSRLAFHSSRKSVAAFDLKPPVAMMPSLKMRVVEKFLELLEVGANFQSERQRIPSGLTRLLKRVLPTGRRDKHQTPTKRLFNQTFPRHDGREVRADLLTSLITGS